VDLTQRLDLGLGVADRIRAGIRSVAERVADLLAGRLGYNLG